MKLDKRGFPVPCENSPLPWTKRGSGDNFEEWKDACGNDVTDMSSFTSMDNEEYAMHAANCFPRHVDVLIATRNGLISLSNKLELDFMSGESIQLLSIARTLDDAIKLAKKTKRAKAKGAPNDQQD